MIDHRPKSVRPMTRFASALAAITCLWGLAIGGTQFSVHAEPVGNQIAAESTLSADSLLLDQYPNALAAYSLEKRRSDFDGDVLRVKRMSDGAEENFGFDGNGKLDISAIESWLGSSDGKATKWYSQLEGHPPLEPKSGSSGNLPVIATGGTVLTDENGNPRLEFKDTRWNVEGLPNSIDVREFTYMIGLEWKGYETGRETFFQLTSDSQDFDYPLHHYRGGKVSSMSGGFDGVFWGDVRVTTTAQSRTFYAALSRGMDNDWALFDRAEKTGSFRPDDDSNADTTTGFHLGTNSFGDQTNWNGYVYEIFIYPEMTPDQYQKMYVVVNGDGKYGPTGLHLDAMLPQKFEWQIDLYDWLETIEQSDVELPDGTISWDGTYSDVDELADIWLKTREASASSVIRSEWEWYTLDAGNGKGIEATDVVRIQHEPDGVGGIDKDGSYTGNPARSWGNEPAWLYDLDIPTNGGSGQGNDWYKDPNLGRRAMVVTAVDMMMRGISGRADMQLRQLLGYAEAYRLAGEVLSSEVRDAFERGFEAMLDDIIETGPHAVNTNLDSFGFKGMVHLYFAADSETLKTRCVEGVKRMLFGYTDGELETNHKLFASQNYSNDGGVFDPSGAVLEGSQPVWYYHGESMNSLAGMLAIAMKRSDGSLPSDWQFLKEVVKRAQEFRTYQNFHYLGKGDSKKRLIGNGKGYSGRTSNAKEQGDWQWKHMLVGDALDHPHKWAMKKASFRPLWQDALPSQSQMQTEINEALNFMDGELANTYTGQPNDWSGWTAWPKFIPYLPEEGWYSRLKTLEDGDDPKLDMPSARSGYTWNKVLGSDQPRSPFGWSYMGTDSNGKRYGFFIEGLQHQGKYGGWYGGKIETFWTEDAGIVWRSMRGKSGCDRSGVDDYSNKEDSQCWFNLDEKAGQHVWGRDENGDGFSTLIPRGRASNRTVNYNTTGSPPTVSVTTQLNDNSYERDGLENDGVLDGNLEVTNTFEVAADGLKITHSLTSDNSDEVTELWASIPAFLRASSFTMGTIGPQDDMSDATLEYYDGTAWSEIPFDTDSDGVPEIVTAEALRFGHDFNDGNGLQWVYVDLASTQDIRRSKNEYHDPSGAHAQVRTIHIDLHGDPGTTKTMPADKSVSYTIQTTDPTSEEDTSTSQVIPLQKGWNIASISISPATPAMDSVFAGIQSEITVVENEVGERYRPAEDINEIGQWDSEEAYLVHATSDTNLSIEGDSLGSSSISLEQGWNWIPYFPSSPLPVNEAVSSITEALVLLKDETGRVYLQEKDPDGLEQMEPGEGYKVYVRNSTTLTYPDDGN